MRSIAVNPGTVVNNIEYATHEKVFSGDGYEEFLTTLEEEATYVDDLFPPEKKSIMGLGCGEGMKSEPRDQYAYFLLKS